MPSESSFFSSLFFGAIGGAALMYGKAASLPKKMLLGAAIIACAWLIDDATTLWLVGGALTGLLAVWKD